MPTSTYINSQLSPLVCVSVDLYIVLDRTCPLAVGGHLIRFPCPHPPPKVDCVRTVQTKEIARKSALA